MYTKFEDQVILRRLREGYQGPTRREKLLAAFAWIAAIYLIISLLVTS